MSLLSFCGLYNCIQLVLTFNFKYVRGSRNTSVTAPGDIAYQMRPQDTATGSSASRSPRPPRAESRPGSSGCVGGRPYPYLAAQLNMNTYYLTKRVLISSITINNINVSA